MKTGMFKCHRCGTIQDFKYNVGEYSTDYCQNQYCRASIGLTEAQDISTIDILKRRFKPDEMVSE